MIQHKGQRGFTLMEVMIAVVILSMGITGVYRVFLSTLKYRAHVAYRLCAMNLANAHLAELSQQFKAGKALAPQVIVQTTMNVNNHDMVFGIRSVISKPGESDALKRAETVVSWWEDERNHKILRSALISK